MTTRLLISVRDAHEASIALDAGADLIDLKEPDAGALGAVAPSKAREIVALVAGRRTTSATVGDLPADPSVLSNAAWRTAACGVDFIKIGFLPSPGTDVCYAIRALAPVAREMALIAVLFADDFPPGDPTTAAAAAGFAGVMLDTARKGEGRLLDYLEIARVREFVATAKKSGLMTGLAGSLLCDDIVQLAGLSPDYLGFRGAACAKNHRVAELDAGRVTRLRNALDIAVGNAACARGAVPCS